MDSLASKQSSIVRCGPKAPEKSGAFGVESTMLVRPFSDLHAEFWQPNKISRVLDMVVLPLPTDKETVALVAGDIGRICRSWNGTFSNYALLQSGRTGNHEHENRHRRHL